MTLKLNSFVIHNFQFVFGQSITMGVGRKISRGCTEKYQKKTEK